MKGRLENSTLQLPILLNKDNHLTKLIIWRSHVQTCSFWVKDSLNHVCQKHWVTRGRQTVKGVIKRCVIWLKQNSKPFRSLPAVPLPHYKVCIDFPFSCTGTDYLGPLYVKNTFKNDSNDLFKGLYCVTYLRKYTCSLFRSSFRCVKSFFCSLKRFIARHGTPKLFISDNTRSFIGPEFQHYISHANIDWNFILDLSAWWGGFWKHLVQMVKRYMHKILQKNKLIYEELQTVISKLRVS